MRKLIFQIHLIVGVVAGLLLLATGLTGSLIVFGEEAEEALNPGLYHVAAKGEALPLQSALDLLKQAFPQEKVSIFSPAARPGQAHQFTLLGISGQKLVSVDPYSGQMLGARERTRTLMGWLIDFHTHLLNGKQGETIVGYAGLLLCVLCLTGLWVWLPRKRQSLQRGFEIKFGAGWKRVNYDLHKTVGGLMLLFLTLTALTGVALVFDDPTSAIISGLTGTASRPPRPQIRKSDQKQQRPLDELREKAEQALPGGELTLISLPQKPTDAIGFRKRFETEWNPKGRSFVYLDPFTGAILRVDDARNAPAGMRAVNLLFPLHTGRWGGTGSRLLQMIIGLTPGFLFLTGFLMWWNRSLAKKLKRPHPSKFLSKASV